LNLCLPNLDTFAASVEWAIDLRANAFDKNWT
jgi:hypothetical protein